MKVSWVLLDFAQVDGFKVYDQLPIGCILIRNKQIYASNKAFKAMIGMTEGGASLRYSLKEIFPDHKNDIDYFKEGQKVNSFTTQIRNIESKQSLSCQIDFTKHSSSSQDQVTYLATVLPLKEVEKESKLDDHLDFLLSNSKDSILALDTDLNVIHYNAAAVQLSEQYRIGTLKKGMPFEAFFTADNFKDRKQNYLSKALKGETVNREVTIDKVDGRFLKQIYKPIYSTSNEIIGIYEIVTDITEEVKSKEFLDQNQLFLSSVMDALDNFYVFFDLDYNIIKFNRKAQRLHKKLQGTDIKLNTSLEEIYGRKGFSERKKEYYDKAINGEDVKRKLQYETDSGTEFINVSYKPIYSQSRQLIGILEYGNNITELVESRSALYKSESLLNIVSLASPNPTFVCDLDFKLTYLNDAAKVLFGEICASSAIIGNQIFDILEDCENISISKEECRTVLSKCVPFSKDLNFNVGDRSYYYKASINCLSGEAEKSFGLLFTLVDVTELRLRKEEIKKSRAIFEAVLNSSQDGTIALDKDFNLLFYNQKAIDEYQLYADVELKNSTNLKEIVPSEILSEWHDKYFNRSFEGESFSNVVKRSSDGKVFQNDYSPVKNSDGEIIGAMEVSKDITDQTKVQQKIEASEKRYRTLIENSPSGIARIGVNGILSYISQLAAQYFGYTSEELEGQHIDAFIHEDSKEDFYKNVKELLQGKTTRAFSASKVIHKDGSSIMIEGFASMVTTNEGHDATEFLLLFNDVTEKHQVMRKFIEAEKNYRYLFDNMIEGVIQYKVDTGEIVNFNSSANEILSYKNKELLAKNLKEILVTESQFYPLLNLKERGDVFTHDKALREFTLVIKCKEGKQKVIEGSLLSTQEVTDRYFVFTDVTQRYLAHKEIEEKSAIYEALIQNSYDGIDIIQYEEENGVIQNGNLLVRNENMVKLMGDRSTHFDSLDELLSIAPDFQLNGKTSREVVKDIIVDTIKYGMTKTNFRFEHSDDRIYDVEASQLMLKLKDYVFMVRNYEDITEKVKAETIINQQIKDLNDKNEELTRYIESNLQLENFAYIASHDLKAPIRSVISFVQLLQNNIKDQIDDKNARFIEIILSASNNMKVLIDDLLAYSRVNTQEIEFEEVDINKLLNRLLVELNDAISEKQAKIIYATELPTSIIVDESRIRQVFQNLILNGIKFQESDVIPTVEIGYREESLHHLFWIKDNGIGIEENYRKEVFLMFKKLHSENKFKGTGIGLSICKKIIEQHQGSIWVESKIGEGATFYFKVTKALTQTL